MTKHNRLDTAAHFLLSQADRIRIDEVERPDGSWDIVLVFDPGYAQRPRTMVTHYRRRLERIMRYERGQAGDPVPVHPAETGHSPEMLGGDPDRHRRGIESETRPDHPQS